MIYWLKKYRKSFTLIELSIVLLVLSLLITATLSGSSIISSANAVKIMKDISNYRQAINQFYQTYEALPGDYNNAQYKFAPSGYAKIKQQELPNIDKDILNKMPLNGSLSGAVEGNIKSISSIHYSEAYGVWNHLSASGLIDGKYSNICYNVSSNSRNGCSMAGYNLPHIRGGYNKNSSFLFYTSFFGVNDIRLYGSIVDQIKSTSNSTTYNILLLTDISRNYVYNSSISLDDEVSFGAGGGISSNIMMKIDAKMDDGFPFTGQVFGVNGANEDNKKDSNLKEGQCTTYTGENNQFTGDSYNSVVYTNDNHKSCVGIILFNEFNN